MVLLCCRDLVSILKHRSRPPTLEDLEKAHQIEGTVETAKTGSGAWSKLIAGFVNRWNEAGRWVQRHLPLVGLIGFAVGALFGHFFWRVGGY
jgi:hypothetical protein